MFLFVIWERFIHPAGWWIISATSGAKEAAAEKRFDSLFEPAS